MLLAIDAGNTHMVFGVFKGADLVRHWRTRTCRDSTADELALQFNGLLGAAGCNPSDINGVIIANVVPGLQASLASYCGTLVDNPVVVSAGMNTGITILTDNPSEVGADRIVNAVAVYERFGGPAVVVDFGTAVTFDCVSKKGEYLGGAIAPGLNISLDALGRKAAKLPRIDISRPPDNPIGRTTEAAIKSGLLFGYGGLVDGLVERIKEQFSPDIPAVLATGGMAAVIAPYARTIETVDPMLTLNGLRLLYEKN